MTHTNTANTKENIATPNEEHLIKHEEKHSQERRSVRWCDVDEHSYAYHFILNFNDPLAAHLVKNCGQMEMDNYRPVVVKDFSSPIEQKVLLVPEGIHEVSREALASCEYMIGLPSKGGIPPTLMFSDPDRDYVINDDTGESASVNVFKNWDCKFANLRLDARHPTVLETGALVWKSFFSEIMQQVDCSENIDVLDVAAMRFYKGREWAFNAYGKNAYESRPMLMKALDGFHENGLKAIDSAFRPLVAMGEKLDTMLGLK